MLHAEKEITRHRNIVYEWSVHFAQAIETVRHWKLRLKCQTGLAISNHMLTVTREAAGLPPSTEEPTTTANLVSNLKTAREYAKSCQKDHVALREVYLQGLAEAIVIKCYPHLDTPGNLHLKAKVAHK
jgi:hypothetical protein